MSGNKRNKLFHVIIFEIEVLVLAVLMIFPVLTDLQPVGVMATGRGDLMRFRFAEGQDEILDRCKCVQVDFGTKWCKHPAAFLNRDLVKYVEINRENRYAWHEIPAPLGTTEFRIAIHWKTKSESSVQGPILKDISLGNHSICWNVLLSNYELYESKMVPCYWFRPGWFWNLSVFGSIVCVSGYFVVINALILLVFLVLLIRRKRLADVASNGWHIGNIK